MDILWYCLLFVFSINFVSSICILKSNHTYSESEIFLRNQIADFDYARVGKYKTIHCCAHRFERILWYFKRNGEIKWLPFPWFPVDRWSDRQPELKNKNQTLEIKDVGLNNGGLYKCVAYSDKNEKIAAHSTEIEVFSCADRIQPVAYPPKTQYRRVGDSVTFTCVGDFGCSTDSARDITWTDENWDSLSDHSLFPRYNVTTVERANHTVIQSNFTIMTVKEEDFLKNFTCFVSSSYPKSMIFTVKVKKTSLHIKTEIKPEVVAAVGSSVFIVLLASVIVIVLFYPTMKLFVLSRIPCGHLVDRGNKFNHALILHEDEDLELARQIKERLTADSYRVILSGSIKGGQDMIETVQEIAGHCKSLIIIYPSEYSSKNVNNIFERLIGTQQYFNCNLITVVKTTKGIQNEIRSLEDKTLVKLTLPLNQSCVSYKQNNFYSRLKLRMPRKDSSAIWWCCTENKEKENAPEMGNLLIGNSPNPSPAYNGEFFHEHDRNLIV